MPFDIAASILEEENAKIPKVAPVPCPGFNTYMYGPAKT